MYTINFWPILVATVVAFAIGCLWYSSVLFGNEFKTLVNKGGKDSEDAAQKGMFSRSVIHLIFTFITFCVIGFIMAMNGIVSASEGAFLGFLVWLGFSFSESLSSVLWENKSKKLVAIQTIGTLVVLVIGGAIIGAW
jgi:hypothetical protein